ncbi:MAG: putative DNA binding domain-containing protein [Oscillospiraceae bacterium]|jgi:ATP-dependent DNA helicase RecG|nr:putative DNA binding domain-containing protein [Oscillospiraceae bacterium]
MEFDFESENLEFKQEYTPTIKKEVIAFANTSGGIIYVGVDKKGNLYPVEDVDGTIQKITNAIRDSILPDLTYLIKYEVKDKRIIEMTVSEGTKKPYFLADKGLTPSGVYVRQGTSSAPASHDLIRKMIKMSDGDKYENERSLNQELTLMETASEFVKNEIPFEENNMITLGLKTNDRLFTNLGFLFSDQCSFTVKVAVFKGTRDHSKMEFKTREEFKGSIFKQFYETSVLLKALNNLPAKIVGFKRVERYDYPPEAIREALLNAVIHRDYSVDASIMIKIYDDCMEFISIGGLVPGISEKDLFRGISVPRNKKLAEIFLRLDYIEAYGTGLRKVRELYENYEFDPKIEISPNVFGIVLPNLNYMKNLIPELNLQHKAILEYLKSNEFINNKTIQNLLSIKQSMAYNVIKEMKELNLIKDGKTRGKYVLNV